MDEFVRLRGRYEFLCKRESRTDTRPRSWRKKGKSRQILLGKVEEEVDDSQEGLFDQSVPVTGCLSNSLPKVNTTQSNCKGLVKD